MTEKKRGRPRKIVFDAEGTVRVVPDSGVTDHQPQTSSSVTPVDITEKEDFEALILTGLREEQKPELFKRKKHAGGRPSIYRDDMPAKIYKYIKEQKAKDSIPTCAGACLALGIVKDTLYLWEKDPDKQEFSDALYSLRLEQEDLLLTGAITGKFRERSSIFILSSVHGYVERKEEKLTVEGTEASLEQVKALMKAFNR
jgi:hypothetical protein